MDAERKFDDEAELRSYIWHNYRHLMMTDDEKLASNAFVVEAKFGTSVFRSEPLPQLFRERRRYENNAYVQNALRIGNDAFREMVIDRILREQPLLLFINRCPKCNRIVATPKAQQCLRCGADWHRSVE